MAELNFMCYDIRGINNTIKRKKILEQLKKLHCSVALIQETHLSETEHLKLESGWITLIVHHVEGKGREGLLYLLINL